MSAEIKTDMKSHSITSYWGGDHLGMMVQITSIEPFKYNPDEAAKYLFGHEGFIQLNLSEAAALCNSLNSYIVEECARRKALLQAELEHLHTIKRTVFNEVAALDPDLFKVSTLSTMFVDRFCPIVKKKLNKAIRRLRKWRLKI